jgi:hypothetical protein
MRWCWASSGNDWGCASPNPMSSTDVRLGAHFGIKSGITVLSERCQRRTLAAASGHIPNSDVSHYFGEDTTPRGRCRLTRHAWEKGANR